MACYHSQEPVVVGRIGVNRLSRAMVGPRVEYIDVGHARGVLEPVQISYLLLDRPFPPNDLINVEDGFRKGQWGFMRSGSSASEKFHRAILGKLNSLVRQSRSQQNTLIVLPEFAGTAALTKEIRKVVIRSKRTSLYVVAGSYYVKRGGKIASIAPIILPNGTIHQQFKFDPAPSEENCGCDPHHDKPLLLFQNTAFGNFAVAICSDALLLRLEKARDVLRREVDLLIVPARNPSNQLPSQLKTMAANEGLIVAYCNGLMVGRGNGDSCIYTPLKNAPKILDPRSNYSIDIQRIRQSYEKAPRSPQRVDDFRPRAKWTRKSPIDFQQRPNVLAIGSHFDDIWLGCAATLMVLQEEYRAQIICVDLCDDYTYLYFDSIKINNSIHSRIDALCRELGFKYDHEWETNRKDRVLRDREFQNCLGALSHRIELLAQRYPSADLVFVPRHDDYHVDHALTAKEALKWFRRSAILEYEVKEFRRGPFHPTLLVDVTRRSDRKLRWNGNEICKSGSVSFAEKKARILGKIFPTILGTPKSNLRHSTFHKLPNTFSREHVLGRLAMRAGEFGLDAIYAEAFATDLIVS